MSAATCTHVGTLSSDGVEVGPPPDGDGCGDCLAIGARWVHLRRCLACGHVGCCDSSPNTHATKHFHATSHGQIQSFEPGEDWIWCFVDEVAFELDLPPSPSHP